jgi:hypothetical protein
MKCQFCGAKRKKEDTNCSCCGAYFENQTPESSHNIGGTLGSPTHTTITTFGNDSGTRISRTAQIVITVISFVVFFAIAGVIIASASGAFSNLSTHSGNPGSGGNAERVEIIGQAQFPYVSPGVVNCSLTVKNNTGKTLSPKITYEIRNNGTYNGNLDINITDLAPNETRSVTGTYTHYSIKSGTKYFFFAIFGTV